MAVPFLSLVQILDGSNMDGSMNVPKGVKVETLELNRSFTSIWTLKTVFGADVHGQSAGHSTESEK